MLRAGPQGHRREPRLRHPQECTRHRPLRLRRPGGQTLAPGGERSDGVDTWYAHEDLQVYLCLNELFKVRGIKTELKHDGDYPRKSEERCTKPTIALGLGFTKHTRELLERSDLEAHVQIIWRRGADGKPTDAIVFNEKVREPKDDSTDFAVVARVVVNNVIHFICAGQTAPGTEVAGWYLANRWEELMKRYGSESKSQSIALLIQYETNKPPPEAKAKIREHALSEALEGVEKGLREAIEAVLKGKVEGDDEKKKLKGTSRLELRAWLQAAAEATSFQDMEQRAKERKDRKKEPEAQAA